MRPIRLVQVQPLRRLARPDRDDRGAVHLVAGAVRLQVVVGVGQQQGMRDQLGEGQRLAGQTAYPLGPLADEGAVLGAVERMVDGTDALGLDIRVEVRIQPIDRGGIQKIEDDDRPVRLEDGDRLAGRGGGRQGDQARFWRCHQKRLQWKCPLFPCAEPRPFPDGSQRQPPGDVNPQKCEGAAVVTPLAVERSTAFRSRAPAPRRTGNSWGACGSP